MMEYYEGLARKYGPLTAIYKNAVCFVWDDIMAENGFAVFFRELLKNMVRKTED